MDRNHGKKLFHTSALNLLTVTHRPPCVHLLPAAPPGVSEPGRGWISGDPSGQGELWEA